MSSYFSTSLSACVPFPDPGGPNSMRFNMTLQFLRLRIYETSRGLSGVVTFIMVGAELCVL